MPARGIERWLAQRLSHRLGAAPGRGDGICAGVALPVAGRAGGRASWPPRRHRPDDDPWQPARAVWPLLEVDRRRCAGEPWCAPLAAHLGGDGPGDARRVAGTPSRGGSPGCSTATPRTGPSCSPPGRAGDDTAVAPATWRWQPRAVAAAARRGSARPTRRERLAAACAALRARPGARPSCRSGCRCSGPPGCRPRTSRARRAGRAPRRAPVAAAPLARAVGPGRPAAGRRRARAAAPRRPDAPQPPRHPLLSSLGPRRPGAAAARWPRPRRDARHRHHPRRRPRPPTLLGPAAAATRATTAPPSRHRRRSRAGDRSVQVHACHGPHRQVEVLREVLVGLLADDETLEPRDILVMCPDIETFAPLIVGGVRAGASRARTAIPAHRLRVRLADRALRQTNPLLARWPGCWSWPTPGSPPRRCSTCWPRRRSGRRFGFDDDDLDRLRDLGRPRRRALGPGRRAPRPLPAAGGSRRTPGAAGLDRLLLGVTMAARSDRRTGWAPRCRSTTSESGDVDAGRPARRVRRPAGRGARRAVAASSR